MRINKRIAGHYAVQEVPFGKDYRWSPETIVLECSKCGKKTTHKRSDIIDSEVVSCECGNKNNTARIWEELVIQQQDEEDKAHHRPWRHDAKARAKQRARDEVAYPEDSAWRYNDVTARNGIEE